MSKAIIIDDEEMARTLLKGMVEEYCPEVNVVDVCKDLPSGVKSIRKNKPDIVFLDIEMPGHSGLELIDFFNEDEVNFSIIFVTAYNQYAIQAFKLSAVDYLLKPVDPEDLKMALQLVQKRNVIKQFSELKNNMQPRLRPRLAVSTVSSIKYLDIDQICFLKADGSYTEIHSKIDEIITASKGLKYYEDVLSVYPQFKRCHKSYIINLNCVEEYIKSDGGSIVIKGQLIPISSEKLAEFIQLLNQ
jgi:two-component system LytT family response regulator